MDGGELRPRGRSGEDKLVGTVDELAERLEALESAGISRVMLQHLDHADLEAIAAMGVLAKAAS